MAKSKNLMVLVGKGSYSIDKKDIKKGQSIDAATYESLPKEHKVFFTDAKTAAKVLKKKVAVPISEEEEETGTGGKEE